MKIDLNRDVSIDLNRDVNIDDDFIVDYSTILDPVSHLDNAQCLEASRRYHKVSATPVQRAKKTYSEARHLSFEGNLQNLFLTVNSLSPRSPVAKSVSNRVVTTARGKL